MTTYSGEKSWTIIEEKKRYYPILMGAFDKWLAHYCYDEIVPEGELKDIALNCENEKIYGNLEEKIYIQAILDFISGMTDRFAIKVFNELLTY